MEEEKFSFSGSFQKGKEYVDTQLELLKLKALARGSRILGVIAVDMVKLVFTLFIVFFLSLALAFFLGELLGSNALGFLVTGLFFALILLIVRAIEPKLEDKIRDFTISKIASRWDDDEEKETTKEDEVNL
ncbi:hypothetical protein ORI89_14435 [Sphingobacterium sp. UT-1RO-CII-1]|uniref:phage holin family protein n=1 Tax=Sphingobacterium sp. UT-1RO-CII-1 TaxID=2995225 RepID=UPI00227C8DAC|nr:phage holin family protein [Sphingobacterium sp. UT-1RO-CII-1]MCY4780854.1 hypothetical protein [Sphingobacterium sp. UT-1RO-CII-1]